MSANDRRVVEYPAGGWAEENENRERVSDILNTQEEAIQRARVIIHNVAAAR